MRIDGCSTFEGDFSSILQRGRPLEDPKDNIKYEKRLAVKYLLRRLTFRKKSINNEVVFGYFHF
jgi:hypothetical protein